MISLHTSSKSFDIDSKTADYIEAKIASLDRYFPRQVKQSQGTVILEHTPSAREVDKYSCEVTISVPRAQFQAKEAALTMFAAIDLVEDKLKAQAAKYKERYEPQRPQAKEALVDLSLQPPDEE